MILPYSMKKEAVLLNRSAMFRTLVLTASKNIEACVQDTKRESLNTRLDL